MQTVSDVAELEAIYGEAMTSALAKWLTILLRLTSAGFTPAVF